MEGGDQQSGQGQAEDGWQYKPEGAPAPPAAMPMPADAEPGPATVPDGADGIEWTASEFIAHDKSFGWYAMLGLVAAGLATIIYLVTRDVVSAAVIVALAVILGVAAGRKPRVVNYRLDRHGITVGPRLHHYGEYKSFALIDEGAFWSVVFLPAKRFALPLSLYLAPEDEQQIVEALGNYLPLEQGKMSAVDRFMRSMRF